jgi:hypothetical protein
MDFAALQFVLSNLGLNITANALYDFLKARLTGAQVPKASFEADLQSFLRVHGATVSAATVIDMLASRGWLSIQGSYLYAPDQITLGAAQGAQFLFGNNSTSQTRNTAIQAGAGAFIQGSNAAIVQGEDGSISFFVGSDKK